MAKDRKEWLKQSDYDFDTAEYMFAGGRYFYAVFMCHIAIEKALKGLYNKITNEVPAKSHNLIYFLNKLEIDPPEKIGKFLVKINQASVVTRYPEDITKLKKTYTKSVVKSIISDTRKTLEWIKKQY